MMTVRSGRLAVGWMYVLQENEWDPKKEVRYTDTRKDEQDR